MLNILSQTKYLTLLLSLCVLLTACNKISQANFDKIKPEMTMDEVVAILGQPTSTNSVTIAGVSGTAAVWKYQQSEINIQFLNGHVFLKTFSNNSNNNTQDTSNNNQSR